MQVYNSQNYKTPCLVKGVTGEVQNSTLICSLSTLQKGLQKLPSRNVMSCICFFLSLILLFKVKDKLKHDESYSYIFIQTIHFFSSAMKSLASSYAWCFYWGQLQPLGCFPLTTICHLHYLLLEDLSKYSITYMCVCLFNVHYELA